MNSWRILKGDCRDVLRSLDAGSAHTCVTSPPYFGLRDYGTDGQIGLEPTPDEFVTALVGVFREVRRVLRDDGTVWLNLGDSFHGGGYSNHRINGDEWLQAHGGDRRRSRQQDRINASPDLKPKDLIGIPWAVAFALRADGWYLRSDVIWSKPNPMPESVTDRPTKAHEYVFLLSKGPRYFYDADAIREQYEMSSWTAEADAAGTTKRGEEGLRSGAKGAARAEGVADGQRYGATAMGNAYGHGGRNKRSVWTVATQPYAGAHFATFPPKLIEPCILAGAPERACGECGAPWVRVVEREPNPTKDTTGPNMVPIGANGEVDARYRSHSGTIAASPPRTVGFEPSCEHADGSASGTVLDPFAGAGTTGMVALRHNRSFVGIELNPEYAAMARERIIGDAPLLNSVAEAA